MKKLIILFCGTLALAACGNGLEKKANEKLMVAKAAYERGDYEEAKLQIDSIKILYPKAFEARKAGQALMLDVETKTQQKIFQYRQGISPLKAVTNSKQAQQVLEKSMGENMTDKMKLLDELMNNALQIPKFRRYNEAYQKIDSEMTRILTDEEEFDSNILKLKQEIDKFLNQ